MSANGKTPTRRLKIAGCREVTRGSGKDGKPWVLYSVEAFDQHGKRILEELRSFEELAPGEDTFTIERRESEQHGTSYSLKRVRRKVSDRLDELERRVAALEAAPPY
jgi:hypothetical protein